MPSAPSPLAGVFAAFVCVVAIGGCRPRADDVPADDRRRIAAVGPPIESFARQPIGRLLDAGERPQIAHVEIADLDRDGLPDVLVCDALKGAVSWIRQAPKGVYTEIALGAPVAAPAHAQAIDFDNDRDLDVVVASLGVLLPNNNRIGSVVILENNGRQRFTPHVAAQGIARAADARAADLDGDGDLDVAVAGFGYDSGETSWLENHGAWRFEPHVLQRLSGAVNAVPVDLDGDADLDIVALVSQEWEEIWAFVNEGGGRFQDRMLWGSPNADFGSSWATLSDLNRDGRVDVLFSNGDAFDYAPANSRPWHGVQWLENRGALNFELFRIGDLPGASSPQAADFDGDGDVDVVVVSAYNNWTDPTAMSLVVLENDGAMRFAMRRIAHSPTHLISLAVADLDGDRAPDMVTGGMHISRPFDRLSRVSLWSEGAPPAAAR